MLPVRLAAALLVRFKIASPVVAAHNT
jgi:hypothetical protein